MGALGALGRTLFGGYTPRAAIGPHDELCYLRYFKNNKRHRRFVVFHERKNTVQTGRGLETVGAGLKTVEITVKTVKTVDSKE